ncbi:TetR family transcriptional regulator [Aureimonas endophytica]|uniref:TetR family transcriptional regulator n=1 Tax=Aureimonas endophytica TaxID=2027858 RepID=A0A916ZQI4_9HYPH|nr:TetR/AcrR family transcriptional regulator [Aureimonas endophytica]GGE06560.1 TetR family transcriptional regulator [Aureimonas endophytica]
MARLVQERGDVVPLVAEVFRRYGFEGASLTRLTEGTKLGKGSLYHFFPGGKEEMAEAVLAHIGDWFETEVFRPLAEEPPARAIDAMFDKVETYFRSGRRICLMGAFALEETRDRFAAMVGSYFARWLAVLATALDRAGLAETPALAARIVAGIQGAIVLARALDDPACFHRVLGELRLAARVPGA